MLSASILLLLATGLGVLVWRKTAGVALVLMAASLGVCSSPEGASQRWTAAAVVSAIALVPLVVRMLRFDALASIMLLVAALGAGAALTKGLGMATERYPALDDPTFCTWEGARMETECAQPPEHLSSDWYVGSSCCGCGHGGFVAGDLRDEAETLDLLAQGLAENARVEHEQATACEALARPCEWRDVLHEPRECARRALCTEALGARFAEYRRRAEAHQEERVGATVRAVRARAEGEAYYAWWEALERTEHLRSSGLDHDELVQAYFDLRHDYESAIEVVRRSVRGTPLLALKESIRDEMKPDYVAGRVTDSYDRTFERQLRDLGLGEHLHASDSTAASPFFHLRPHR